MTVSISKLAGGARSGGGSTASFGANFSRERPAADSTHSPDGQAVLKPRIARWQQALLVLGIALFWNGIVSVFVFQAYEGWRNGRPDWGLIFFISIFVIIGLVLFGGFLHALLALRNPHSKILITPAHPRLGGTLRLAWEMSGETSRLQSFKMHLECREMVTRKSGKNSSTTTTVIHREEVVSITDRLSMRSGQVELRVPGEAMHSFQATNCRIEWLFVVHGDIPNWPDLKEEFPFWMDPHNP